MSNVPISIFTTVRPRSGAFVGTPSLEEGGGAGNPLNPEGSGPSVPVSFLGLTDTPTTYSGQGLKGVRVNTGETGLEFLDFDPIESTGASVLFDKVGGYIHGNAAAITGNITYNFTGEILGSTAFMLHNDSTLPTFPAETKIIKGSYVASTDNYIWFCITKIATGRIVQVTISQV